MRADTVEDMADAIPAYVDLDDEADVIFALYAAGFVGREIGKHIDEAIRLARAIRASSHSN